jgi:uncharacterized protein YjbJ (UPF0337 family)
MGDTSNKWEGKAKKMGGKVTGDRKMEAKGKAQEEIGKIEGKFENK